MPESPVVSIVMTNFNGEKYIEQTIRSVLAQTYKNWELIIVDDCSTDQSVSIIQRMKDERISLIECGENGHISMAHNIGNARAKGDYIATIDSDDIWKPDKLRKQIEYLEAHPETGLCFTLVDLIDEKGDAMSDPEIEKILQVKNQSRERWLHDFLVTGSHLVNSSSVVRKTVMDQIGENDICLLQLHDYDLWVRAALFAEFHVIEEPLMHYRRHSNSYSSTTYGRIHRTCFEFAWIIGRTVAEMPASLFRKVFSSEMIHPEAVTEEEIMCEKAILLSGDSLHENCRAFAFYLYNLILKNPKTAIVLKSKYGLRQHDVYRMTEIPIFFDRYTAHEFYLQSEEYNKLAQQMQELERRLGETEQAYRKASEDFLSIQASPYWKITAPIRKAVSSLKKIVNFSHK